MLFAIGSFVAGAQTTTTVFYESFDQSTGKGGTDGLFGGSGTGNGSLKADNTDWVFTKAYGANKCIKIGASGSSGSAITPALNIEGEATLIFQAASWDGDETTLNVSISTGSLNKTEFKLSDTQ